MSKNFNRPDKSISRTDVLLCILFIIAMVVTFLLVTPT